MHLDGNVVGPFHSGAAYLLLGSTKSPESKMMKEETIQIPFTPTEKNTEKQINKAPRRINCVEDLEEDLY